MSNITQLFRNEIFDADAVVAMGNAYDLARQTLQNSESWQWIVNDLIQRRLGPT
jgi:hypothetical protein